MARVSKHGTEVGTLTGLTSAKRYMSDGTVLVHRGFGWKVHARAKAGVAMLDIYTKAEAKQKEKLAQRPAYARYKKLLHNMAGLGKRWKLHTCVEMMPDDCDGVWSEACDGYGDNIHADVSEVHELCEAFKAAMAESDKLREKVNA